MMGNLFRFGEYVFLTLLVTSFQGILGAPASTTEDCSKGQRLLDCADPLAINATARSRIRHQKDDVPAPTGLFTSLKGTFTGMGDKAKAAKKGLIKMQDNWNALTNDQRKDAVTAMSTAASKMEKFTNAGSDPIGAIRAALDIGAAFSSLAGPKGQVVSIVLSFISGFLSLFGKGEQQPRPVGEIVREEIEKWYSRDLSNQARGAIGDFQISKDFLDGVASEGNELTSHEAGALSSNVPIYRHVDFMFTIRAEIERIVNSNSAEEATRCTKYIELYSTMAVLKDLILQQLIALMPDSMDDIRNGIFNTRASLLQKSKRLFQFLYESDIGNKVLPYFDPDVQQMTDAYAITVLGMTDYDRSMAGTYYISTKTSARQLSRLGFASEIADFATLGAGTEFKWKLVPHGKNLFSIINKYNCPGHEYCDYLLSWHGGTGNSVLAATVAQTDPALWEITRRSGNQFRIRCKKGCKENSDLCDAELSFYDHNPVEWPRTIVKVQKNANKSWRLRKLS